MLRYKSGHFRNFCDVLDKCPMPKMGLISEAEIHQPARAVDLSRLFEL